MVGGGILLAHDSDNCRNRMTSAPPANYAHASVYIVQRSDCELVTNDTQLLTNFMECNEGVEGVEFVDRTDYSDVVVLFEEFSFKLWDYADTLRSNSFIREFHDRVFVINYDDLGRGFLPGCYTSLHRRNFDRALHRPCTYPKSYNEFIKSQTTALKEHAPSLLFSFSGTARSHPVRRAVAKLLSAARLSTRPTRRRLTLYEGPSQSYCQEMKKLKSRLLIRPFTAILCKRKLRTSTKF